MVGLRCFFSWPTKKFSLQNGEKTERKKLMKWASKNTLKIHLQVSNVLAFYFFPFIFSSFVTDVLTSFFFPWFFFFVTKVMVFIFYYYFLLFFFLNIASFLFFFLFSLTLIGQKRIDPLWWSNWLISQVY